MHSAKKAVVYALISVLLWSTVGTAFKLSLRYLSPIELLLFSSLFSCVVLGIILVYQSKWRLIFQCSRNEYLLSILLGFLNPFLYYLVLFKAYDLLPVQQAQPINYTWAITLTLLSIPLLNQKLHWYQVLALVISYAGVFIISTKGKPLDLEFTSLLGVSLALLSTVVWALYWIFNTRNRRDPVVALFINFIFSLPFIIAYYLLAVEPKLVPVKGLIGAAYVGFFEMGICFVMWLLAMKLSNSTARISNLIFISPFLSLIFARYILDESIVSGTYVGLILIVIGLLVQQIKVKSG